MSLKKIMGVACCVLLSTATISAQQSISSIQEQTNTATECVPACSDGFVCVNGQCVERCNPPCLEGEECDNNGNCIKKHWSAASKNADSLNNSKSSKVIYRSSITGEIPWNGLAGIGVVYTYRPIPYMALDGGLGLSSMGFKYGLRGRYCFLDKNFSPFVSMGYMRASGSDNVSTTVNSTEVTFDLKPENFLQLMGGIDLVTDHRFTIIAGLGWAIALNDGVENVYYDGTSENNYNNDEDISTFHDVCDILYKGGLVLSFGIGFSF